MATVGLGHMQPLQEIAISQGETYTTPLYFYNQHGDRITYVKMKVGIADPGIRITLNPEKETIACPMPVILQLPPGAETSLEIAKTYPSGNPNCPVKIAYLRHPTGGSYIPSSVVYLTFTVPSDASIGTYQAQVEAEGYGISESGSNLPGIAAIFDYKILVRGLSSKQRIEQSESLSTLPPITISTPHPSPASQTRIVCDDGTITDDRSKCPRYECPDGSIAGSPEKCPEMMGQAKEGQRNLPNLSGVVEELKGKGINVTGPLPTPGFETVLVLATLAGVGLLLPRRR